MAAVEKQGSLEDEVLRMSRKAGEGLWSLSSTTNAGMDWQPCETRCGLESTRMQTNQEGC
jgi:hypothetical protein